MRHFLLLTLLPISSLAIGASANAETIRDFLEAFHKDPARMMQRLPSQVDENGNAIPRGYIDDNPELERMVELRDDTRVRVMNVEMGARAPFAAPMPVSQPDPTKDNPELVVEPGTTLLRNMSTMEQRHLTQVSLPPMDMPWADSYWPIYRGLTAFRYAGGGGNTKDWMSNYVTAQESSAAGIASTRNASLINSLSPAEKYDLLVGDSNYTLTRYAWNQGRYYYEKFGVVPSWMGICHGWSGASHMGAKIPAVPITLSSTNGIPVTLYPQDIKALQSMLWANASPPSRFAGNRCSISHPARDRFGRIIDPSCLDVNPATWHLVAVNQMGIYHRSFVLDATYDAEVWNFPMVSFKYRYFNPQTWEEGATLKSAMIPIKQFTIDKFSAYRSPNAKKIVGVYMDVTYVKEINPTRAFPVKAPLQTVRLVYDLELDDQNNVIRGEWYSNGHPDFLWTFDKSAQASTGEDAALANEVWNAAYPIPITWTDRARRASVRGAPLASFLLRSLADVPAAAPEIPLSDSGNSGSSSGSNSSSGDSSSSSSGSDTSSSSSNDSNSSGSDSHSDTSSGSGSGSSSSGDGSH